MGSFLQRFFTTFPERGPGAGLLLLRTFAGGVTALHGGLWLAQADEPTAAAFAIGLLAILSGVALVAGFLTPAAGLAVGVSMLFLLLQADRVVVLLVVVDGIALALLGPGAHSVDAYLFGRREIIIPSDSRRR